MKATINRASITIALTVVLFAAGCAKKPPSFTVAEGTVTLNGQPLPHVTVQFYPLLEDFGAEFNSVGLTDEKGHFKLESSGLEGAAVCKHKVVIIEGPAPAEARGQSEKAQKAFTDHRQGLKNRPIPSQYGSFSQTPLEVEVTTGKTTYDLPLKR
jgi:hypothetical protein